MWTRGQLKNMTQTVAIAYSAAIGRHVLIFAEQADARYPKMPARASSQREMPMLQRLANAHTLPDLLEAASYYGSLFDGVQACMARYSTNLHGDWEDPSFVGRLEDFHTPSHTRLAQEFYSVEKPTRTQLRHAAQAAKAHPLNKELLSISEPMSNDAPTIRAEPLSDWMAFSSMLELCMRAKLKRSDNENIQSLSSVGTAWVPLVVKPPLPSLYGRLLESCASEDNCSEIGANGLVVHDEEQSRYVIGRAWMPGEFLSSDEYGVLPVDRILNLHARGVHIELHGSQVNYIASSKAPLLFSEAMDEIAKNHVGICAREGCGRVFFAQRSDTRFCSNTCKVQASKKDSKSTDR